MSTSNQNINEVISDDSTEVTGNNVRVVEVTANYQSMTINDYYNMCIIDSGADTNILGKGWTVISEHPTRKANVIGFDSELAIKKNLPIVTAITSVDLPDNTTILLRAHESVYNKSCNQTLLSDYQLRQSAFTLDIVPKKFNGTQTYHPNEDNVIPLTLRECMMTFKHRTPADEEIENLVPIDITIVSKWKPKEQSDGIQEPINNGKKFLKSQSSIMTDRTGAPDNLWFRAMKYISDVYNICANEALNWNIPNQVSGGTQDILHLLQFYWMEPVLYFDPVSKFPATKEKPGYLIGFAQNIGDALCFKILKKNMKTIIHRSVVCSALDLNNRNKQVVFDEVNKEILDKVKSSTKLELIDLTEEEHNIDDNDETCESMLSLINSSYDSDSDDDLADEKDNIATQTRSRKDLSQQTISHIGLVGTISPEKEAQWEENFKKRFNADVKGIMIENIDHEGDIIGFNIFMMDFTWRDLNFEESLALDKERVIYFLYKNNFNPEQFKSKLKWVDIITYIMVNDDPSYKGDIKKKFNPTVQQIITTEIKDDLLDGFMIQYKSGEVMTVSFMEALRIDKVRVMWFIGYHMIKLQLFIHHLINNNACMVNISDQVHNDTDMGINEVLSNTDGEVWIGDSGATNHFTHNDALMFDVKTVNERFIYGNGEQDIITMTGSIILQLRNAGRYIILEGMRYVPSLKFNLFSVVSVLRNNGRVYNDRLYLCVKVRKTEVKFDAYSKGLPSVICDRIHKVPKEQTN